MELFKIDETKCTKCGACIAECPLKIISMNRGKPYPFPVPELADSCINCGHCVSVCPEAALTHRSLMPEQCLQLREDWVLSPEQAEHFLRYRRSIRTYKKKSVPRDTLEQLINTARYAPSGHNMQPVNWLIIHDEKELQRLNGIVADWMRYMIKEQPDMAQLMHLDLIVGAWESGTDLICRGAPHVIAAYGHSMNPMSQGSCTIALSYLELAASSLGLGTCWAGYFQRAISFFPPMQEALNLPEGHISYGAMMIGYPRFRYHRMPERNDASVLWR